jgi:hypothetical protein
MLIWADTTDVFEGNTSDGQRIRSLNQVLTLEIRGPVVTLMLNCAVIGDFESPYEECHFELTNLGFPRDPSHPPNPESIRFESEAGGFETLLTPNDNYEERINRIRLTKTIGVTATAVIRGSADDTMVREAAEDICRSLSVIQGHKGSRKNNFTD